MFLPMFIMVMNPDALHHLSIRKRVHLKEEKYPNPDKKVRTLDKLIYVVGVVGPLMILPQIIKIFVLKEAQGVSLLSYSSLVILSGIWLWYGIVHKEKPIIITNSLWMVLHAIIVIGVLIYGKGFL